MVELEQKLQEVNKLIFVKAYEDAFDMLRRLCKDYQAELLCHLRLVELAGKLERLNDLQKDYIEALKSNPHSFAHELSLIFIDQQGGFVSEAETIADLQTLLKTHGEHPGISYALGFAFELSGNLERAYGNYEHCVLLDHTWYPGYFGLSQVCYQLGDQKQGDKYFYLFEQAAPYNVYGNFSTHKSLSEEFRTQKKYREAAIAITSLSDWWVENKGHCPQEVLIHEYLTIARIAETQGDLEYAEERRAQSYLIAGQALNSSSMTDNIAFFIAKVFEEFGELEYAFKFYKKVLSLAGDNEEIVQKVGGKFLTMGEPALARELFEEAYRHHPDNKEIRFCLLVSKLRQMHLNVEEYLITKERLKQVQNSTESRVELLSVLHSLLSQFQEDPDVHAIICDVYLKMGNLERAAIHNEKVIELDPLSKSAKKRYATFHMHYGDADLGMKTVESMGDTDVLSQEDVQEINWLRASYKAKRGDPRKSHQILDQILVTDPWNLSYIILQVENLLAESKIDRDALDNDQALTRLKNNQDGAIDWEAFDRVTELALDEHLLELAYHRSKLRYLYGGGHDRLLYNLVVIGGKFDAARSTHDFLRLLNTNFDGPSIYWALGKLFKELWQLETASMWFEQAIGYPARENPYKGRSYLELADCYIWRGYKLSAAVEYAKLALDLGEDPHGQAITVLAHGLLKSGQVREAKVYLEQEDEDKNPEATYLRGLVEYRNGFPERANEIWKPLLTHRTRDLRFYNIKQEIMRFYFDKEKYMNAN